MNGLTEVQKKHLEWYMNFFLENHHLPSLSYTSKHFGVSQNACACVRAGLVKKGFVKKTKGGFGFPAKVQLFKES